MLALVTVLALTVIAAGCGGTNEETSGGTAKTCHAAPLTTEPALPADFPKPAEVTYTKAEKAGPATFVDGYWDAGFDEAYNEYKDAVEAAGYKILFTEKEEHDAEISYEASDTSGQIALRDECSESDTTAVHITNRLK